MTAGGSLESTCPVGAVAPHLPRGATGQGRSLSHASLCHTPCSLQRPRSPCSLCHTEQSVPVHLYCCVQGEEMCVANTCVQCNYLLISLSHTGVTYRDENAGNLRSPGRRLAHPEVCTCRNHSLST